MDNHAQRMTLSGTRKKTCRFSGGMHCEQAATGMSLTSYEPLAIRSRTWDNVSMEQEYKHKAGSVSFIRYHFVWIPRRRRAVLIGDVATRMDELTRTKASELAVAVLHFAIQPDHVHLFVSAPPDIAPAHIAFRLKGATARVLRQEFTHLQRMPSMWTSSYFVSTAGTVSAATIERYIQAQSTRA